MGEPICLICGAGERWRPPPQPGPDDFVVAADGGFAYLESHGIRVDLLVGDFDSLDRPPSGVETVVLPHDKDETDMAAALRLAWRRGWREFHLWGGTGGRIDHTLANLQCLAQVARAGGRAWLFDRDQTISAIHNGAIAFPASAAGVVSVFAHSDVARGVCETGLRYALDQADLSNDVALGVSNEFIGQPSRITVAEGTLLVVYPRPVQELRP
ncbi:MAG: thiamine diphosphokinase [Propionibacteriaceae bacterium]|jgi:thiamine pyrophosphokinase|nr:thiamine diphosphokinase [Propionibacteriaceae bacterium]